MFGRIILLFSLFTINQFFAQMSCDCGKYRIGKFEVSNGDGTESVIKRTKKIQIELSNGIEIKNKVVWIDRCTYKLFPIEINDKRDIILNEVLIFKIIETSEHSYKVEVTFESKDSPPIIFVVYEFGYLGKG
jgi:hypothetical protein